MVADIVAALTSGFSALVTAMSTLILDAFEILVYNETDGLTDVATWGLVFAGLGIVIGIVNRFARAT